MSFFQTTFACNHRHHICVFVFSISVALSITIKMDILELYFNPRHDVMCSVLRYNHSIALWVNIALCVNIAFGVNIALCHGRATSGPRARSGPKGQPSGPPLCSAIQFQSGPQNPSHCEAAGHTKPIHKMHCIVNQ